MTISTKMLWLLGIWMVLAAGAGAMTYEEELAEFKRIGNTYMTAWDKVSQDREGFLLLVRDYPAKAAWYTSTYAKYKPEVEAKSDKGKTVFSAAKTAAVGLQTFMENAGGFAANFAPAYQEQIAKAKSNAASAESERLPNYYRFALSNLDNAQWMVSVLVGFNGDQDPSARQFAKEIQSMRDDYTRREAELIKATARVVKPPVDTYTGADREALRKAIRDAWTKQYPKDQLVKVVLNLPEWKINRFSRWNDTQSQWDHIDKSFLEASVVVKKNADTAQVFAAFVNKDNRSGAITYGVDTKGSGFVVDELPLADVK